MKFHDFKIKQDKRYVTNVFIDGVKLNGVISVDYSKDTNSLGTITLKIVTGSLNIESEENK